MSQQEDSEKSAHKRNVKVSVSESKTSTSHVESVKSAQLPSARQDSKELEQGINVNNHWRQIQCDVVQMRQTVNEDELALNNKKQELREKETVLVNVLQNSLCEEQQERTRVEEELSRERERMQNDLAQIRQALNDEVRLRDTRERELREKETILDQLQNTLGKERQVREGLEERLQTEMLASQRELQTKENAYREQQRLLEEERQQKATLEERLRNLELQMQEERNRYLSNERQLQSAVSAAQEELTEYQRRQPKDWIIQREEVLLSESVLGKGAWGSVRQGTFRGCQVAVKEIHELILSPHNRRLFEREMSIASCCRHPNLLQFIGATNDDGRPLFVTELLETSLRHLLSERALNLEEIVSLALDVAKGLNYLHLNRPLPIIHRDISSANVLLWRRNDCWRAKLSDYGSANFMRQCMTVSPGAIIYSAPEALTSQQSPRVRK